MRWLSNPVLDHLCKVADWPDFTTTRYEVLEQIGRGGMADVYLALVRGPARFKKLVAVKAPVFSMSKLIGVDTYLGPEMKSTGEVMGGASNFGVAFAKAQLAVGQRLPESGTAFTRADRWVGGSQPPPVSHGPGR